MKKRTTATNFHATSSAWASLTTARKRPSAEAPNERVTSTARSTDFQSRRRAALFGGNTVELLIGRANSAAWVSAVGNARTSIVLENYIFDESDVSRELRDTLAERAAAGVHVKVIRDWLGCLGSSRDEFWKPLRDAGGEVRTYNPFRFASPFGWLPRDHRKLLVVDAQVGFISGVCVSEKSFGQPARGITPWRDTGVAVRGPALHDLAVAFAETWARLGEELPASLPVLTEPPPAVGNVSLRVVATSPGTTGLYRLDLMIAAMAQRTLWLTDAYFVGLAPYVQALAAAARDGVDVRLLVPGTSDLPAVGALSRAGYRPLLEAGVRVYEWNGSMLHAKTAVADGRWARVSSSILNIASWMGNCEIDVAIEDEEFGRSMEVQYEQDLRGATEIILRARLRPERIERKARSKPRGAGSGRVAARADRGIVRYRPDWQVRRRPRCKSSVVNRGLFACASTASTRPSAFACSTAQALSQGLLRPSVTPADSSARSASLATGNTTPSAISSSRQRTTRTPRGC